MNSSCYVRGQEWRWRRAASCAGIWMRAPALSPHCNLSNAYSSAVPGRPSHWEGHPLWGSAATGAPVLCAPNEKMLSKYSPALRHYITLASRMSHRHCDSCWGETATANHRNTLLVRSSAEVLAPCNLITQTFSFEFHSFFFFLLTPLGDQHVIHCSQSGVWGHRGRWTPYAWGLCLIVMHRLTLQPKNPRNNVN